MFNLDRFRFEKKPATTDKEQHSRSIRPECEENKPAKIETVKSLAKSRVQGVIFVDETSDSEDDETFKTILSPPSKITLTRKVKCPLKRKVGKKSSSKEERVDVEEHDEEQEERIEKLLEVFPQRSRQELLEVIDRTSTLDGAVALCITTFGDKAASQDGSKKRKQDGSSSSQDSDAIQPNKKRKSSLVSCEEEEEAEPNWEKLEGMVRRLQRKFPDQDKEELRMVLQQHDWHFEDALEALQLFSDKGDDDDKSKAEDGSRRGHRDGKNHKAHRNSEDSGDSGDDGVSTNHRNSREAMESHRNSDVTEDSEDNEDSDDSEDDRVFTNHRNSREAIDHLPMERRNHTDRKDQSNAKNAKSNGNLSSMSTWLSKGSNSSRNITSTFSSSSVNKMLARFASGTSVAKKESEERKRKARASDKHVSSEGEDEEEETVASDYEDSENELTSEEEDDAGQAGRSGLKEQILKFFEESSLDELSLIAGCSLKKAQKIVELRPFDSWETLIELFHKENGLSEDLLQGCKLVLKERCAVVGLMSKCETISSKMVKQATRIMEKGVGVKQPSILNSQLQLKPYQLIGVKWLLLLHQHKLSGILADEMGLGKTIQAIAFLSQLFQDGIEGPHLITVPSSTLDNWVRELKLWSPRLKVLVYYGSVEDRRYMKHSILNGDEDFNVIVSTYNLTVGNDSDRTLFRKLQLKYAVFDEGHMLKNMNSLRYRHLMAINAEHRLLLTGTPLQNNLLELMSLLNFIMPSMFSSSTTQVSKMFKMKSHEEHSRFARDRIAQAKLIMKPFIFRRLKSEVLHQLPAKEETIEFCSMSDKQQTLYQALFKQLKKSTTGEKRELCNVMMQLRKMANHPLLHRQYYTTEKLKVMSRLMLKEPTHFDADAELIQEDMEVMSDFELHRLCQQYSSVSSYQLEKQQLLDSGKFHHLTGLLASLKDMGDRVVLFSQFTMMLDIVEILLRHLKHRYVRLDGSTPIVERIGLIDDFNNDRDIFVFLLSTRAGGLGINLTSANAVILHDIDCNPYNDKQAEDRCHRVGQTRTVKVIKLISKDSIEDNMLQLGQKKLKLEQDMTASEEGGEGTIPEDMASLLKASLGL